MINMHVTKLCISTACTDLAKSREINRCLFVRLFICFHFFALNLIVN